MSQDSVIIHRRHMLFGAAVVPLVATVTARAQSVEIPAFDQTASDVLLSPDALISLDRNFTLALWLAYGLKETGEFGEDVREPFTGQDTAPVYTALNQAIREPEFASAVSSIMEQNEDDLSQRDEALAAFLDGFSQSLDSQGISVESPVIGNAVISLVHVERIMAAVELLEAERPTDEPPALYICRVWPLDWWCQ